MKLVLVLDAKVIDVIEVESIEIDGTDIKYVGKEGPSEINGIKADFYVVKSEYEIGQELNDGEINNLQSNDKKADFIKVSLEEENKHLKERLESTEMAILSLLDFI